MRIIVLVLCIVSLSAGAGELPAPVDQPLAVVRADEAKLFRDIAETRQARAFGLNAKDFSGAVPGTGVSVESLREFLDALSTAKAKNLWYCLLQDGGTLARQTGGFGWEQPGEIDAETAETWGLQGGAFDTLPLPSGATRVLIARDDKTKNALTGGSARRQEAWRADLRKFLDRNDAMAGALVNSRPLSGLLSLAAGVDVRGSLARFGLSFPVSAQWELFANGGDLGFEARLNALVPAQEKAAASVRREVLSFQRNALLEVNFPAMELFLRHLPFDAGLFALANLDASALIPKTVNLTIWRRDDGTPAWAVVCLLADCAAFRAQLRRLEAWAEALAGGGGSAVEMTEAVSPDGRLLRLLRGKGFEAATGVAEADGGSGYFIVSGSAEDWVNPRTIHRQAATNERLMQYRAALDAAGRREAAEALAGLTRQFGPGIEAGVWEQALPERDSGYLSVDGESLVLMSRNGLLPFIVPWLADFFK